MEKLESSKAITLYKGRILMILRDNTPTIDFPNMWEPPGGGFKENELKEDAILREFKEELSITPSNYKFIKEYVYDNPETKKKWVINIFLIELSDDEFNKLKLNEEGQEFKFFSTKEIENYKLTPLAKEMVKVYKKGS